MTVTMTDLKYVQIGEQGSGLRFSLDVKDVFTVVGLLACRNDDDKLVIRLPKAGYKAGKAFRRYEPVKPYPAFLAKLTAEIDRRYGKNLVGDTPRNRKSKQVPVEKVDPNADTRVDIDL